MLFGRRRPSRSPGDREREVNAAANRSTARASSVQVSLRSPSIRATFSGLSDAARPIRSARLRGCAFVEFWAFVGFVLIAASVSHLQAPGFNHPAATATADGRREPYGKTRIAGMTADPT